MSLCSVRSNGILKKKKKNKLTQKLSSNHNLKEAVTAASDVASMTISPKNMKKKNKKRNKKPQKSSNTEKMDANSQKTSDHAFGPADASVKNKGVKKELKNGSAVVPGSKKTEKTGKKAKKRTKSGQAKGEMPMTPESNEAKERRTIFVGNVSTKTTRKSLARFFSKYGKVFVSEGKCSRMLPKKKQLG